MALIPAPYKHQIETTDWILGRSGSLITSDPGTGKTRSVLDAFAKEKRLDERLLVFGPLSILESAWGGDISLFQPRLSYSIAYSSKRERAVTAKTDIVLSNHDAVKWFINNPQYLDNFNWLCIDEFTAYKNGNTQRTKSIQRLVEILKINGLRYRIAMSGTPTPNTITEIWQPTKLIDDGQRLGNKFWTFRDQMCVPTHHPAGYTTWSDKPNANDVVAGILADINIRYKLEDCIDLPERNFYTMYTVLPPKLQDMYEAMAAEAVLELNSGVYITAVNAGVKIRKLLQICTGAVYNEQGIKETLDNSRYELVLELVKARECSIVCCNWKHEILNLSKLAEQEKIKYQIIDGSTPVTRRPQIVKEFQSGEYQMLLVHPQAASHGLTLTRAKTTIWCSPTYNSEHYLQANQRFYRIGQNSKTEVIHIAAKNTWESQVYNRSLNPKLARQSNLLNLLKI